MDVENVVYHRLDVILIVCLPPHVCRSERTVPKPGSSHTLPRHPTMSMDGMVVFYGETEGKGFWLEKTGFGWAWMVGGEFSLTSPLFFQAFIRLFSLISPVNVGDFPTVRLTLLLTG
ncbi:MAG: hypothetical protein QW801_01865 [Candidatus Caldarchaeum sp.]